MFDTEAYGLDGYKPVTMDSGWATLDSEIAESMPCPKCGSRMYYEGFVTPASYRAFAVCTKCGNVEEF
ncbi:MAG: hypothetical protein WC449_04685 [Candidatus Paceibacterota bacterium]